MSKRSWSEVQNEGETQFKVKKEEENGDVGDRGNYCGVKKEEHETRPEYSSDADLDESMHGVDYWPVSEDLHVLEYEDGQISKRILELVVQGKSRARVIIPSEYMTNTQTMVRSRQMWGDGVYTHDSDIVPVLIHQGFYRNKIERPPSPIAEVQCILKFEPGRTYYPSATRNRLCSRMWKCAEGCAGSYSVERCWLKKIDGTKISLTATPDHIRFMPTFAPASFDRVMNTRSTAASAERRQRFSPEVAFMFNLCNEPWRKYCLDTIADRGLKQWQWTSARLHSEVLYMESSRERYELSWTEEDPSVRNGEDDHKDQYRWSRCCQPLSQSAMRQIGIPLPTEAIEPIHVGLSWRDVKWGPWFVEVLGKQYHILRVHFMPRGQTKEDSQNSS